MDILQKEGDYVHFLSAHDTLVQDIRDLCSLQLSQELRDPLYIK